MDVNQGGSTHLHLTCTTPAALLVFPCEVQCTVAVGAHSVLPCLRPQWPPGFMPCRSTSHAQFLRSGICCSLRASKRETDNWMNLVTTCHTVPAVLAASSWSASRRKTGIVTDSVTTGRTVSFGPGCLFLVRFETRPFVFYHRDVADGMKLPVGKKRVSSRR